MANKKATQQDERAALIPGTAPPPYSELPSASTSHQTPPAPAPAHPHLPHHSPSPSHSSARPYPSGPTAFAALPAPTTSTYAHARALRQADRRARRRFCAALCWGFILYVALGMLIGGILGEELASYGDGDWAVRRVAPSWWRREGVEIQDRTLSLTLDTLVPPDPSYAVA
ncbi:hypothetical protein JCM6882_000162 [Rhodosporidiobolus microsporus]